MSQYNGPSRPGYYDNGAWVPPSYPGSTTFDPPPCDEDEWTTPYPLAWGTNMNSFQGNPGLSQWQMAGSNAAPSTQPCISTPNYQPFDQIIENTSLQYTTSFSDYQAAINNTYSGSDFGSFPMLEAGIGTTPQPQINTISNLPFNQIQAVIPAPIYGRPNNNMPLSNPGPSPISMVESSTTPQTQLSTRNYSLYEEFQWQNTSRQDLEAASNLKSPDSMDDIRRRFMSIRQSNPHQFTEIPLSNSEANFNDSQKISLPDSKASGNNQGRIVELGEMGEDSGYGTSSPMSQGMQQNGALNSSPPDTSTAALKMKSTETPNKILSLQTTPQVTNTEIYALIQKYRNFHRYWTPTAESLADSLTAAVFENRRNDSAIYMLRLEAELYEHWGRELDRFLNRASSNRPLDDEYKEFLQTLVNTPAQREYLANRNIR